MAWFAMECHWTTNQVYDTPWADLVQLTLVADDVIDQRRSQAKQAEMQNRQPQRLA